jgi:hypothetical protein
MELRLKINRMNPAEYFASLGVLELVSKRGPALSHFAGDGNLVDFVVSAEDVTLPDLRTLTVEALPFDDTGTAPVLVNGMRLDWWLDVYKEKKNKNLAFWSGTCMPDAMLRNYQSLMTGAFDEKALNVSVMTKTKSCFNLDTRASRDALDAGYSQKDAGEKSVLYPYTEFLCACGLQNFRPTMKPMTYYTWSRPVFVNIAHAACRQEVNGLGSRGFEVSMTMVGQGLRQVDPATSKYCRGLN